MGKATKFGTFSGVFTPSILTILGVIMYMRLGWVVGQSGLYAALGIIVIAHIISFSTGLSISSIATDKKIKTGGIYYILSRSLGLPMGGAIGIALTIGTALSISLYIIGFAESILSVQPIADFLGLGTTVDDYRILGTGVIIFLVLIAFISTSLAIKTQFFILTAIFLSLISIIIGFFNTDTTNLTPTLLPLAKGGESLEYVFSIFFPAVTGFTAGVAMSGDLVDPRKNIPSGTMLAIGVGFIVYVGLAISFSFFVDRELLISDNNFLIKISWFAPLVLAGIWGATLSSALGGILGAPRILQAISKDKITPKLFAKGYGESNEPRNALILIFLIAEVGILIGELNVIAGIVSMFYLASYGFINLAYALESWASTDFRPNFRVPRITGIIGFLACFAVMFKLDFVSMVIALVIMFGIFFLLQRRELKLEFGDVWISVWTSVVRKGLKRIDKYEIEERNWQPNIILFSGGTKRRPHLIEFGRFIVGRYGMLSNFDLQENKDAKVLFPKHQQSMQNDDTNREGIFTRRQTCRDIYEGIETISSTYGFSGVEPNTVLMGWARESQNPVRFAQMLNTLSDLDLNILLVDYDKRFGFGKYKQIDIWWRGAGNNGNLALTIAKFIWLSNEWREAKVRLLVVNSKNDEAPEIQKNAEQVFESLRINAEIKIINNEIEQKSFYDIIRIESLHSDLIFLGIPPKIDSGSEEEFVQNISALMLDIGTVVLAKAASRFKKLNFASGFEIAHEVKQLKKGIEPVIKHIELNDLQLPENPILSNEIEKFWNEHLTMIKTFQNDFILKLLNQYLQLLEKLKQLVEKSYTEIVQKTANCDLITRSKLISKIQNNFYLRARKYFQEMQEQNLENQKLTLELSLKFILQKTTEINKNIPARVIIYLKKEQLIAKKEDTAKILYYKRKLRWKYLLFSNNGKLKHSIKFKQLINLHFENQIYSIFYKLFDKIGIISFQYLVELQKSIKYIQKSLLTLENKAKQNKYTEEVLQTESIYALKNISELEKLSIETQQSILNYFVEKMTKLIQIISDNAQEINANQLIKEIKPDKNVAEALTKHFQKIPEFWYENQKLLYNSLNIELRLYSFENKIRKIFYDNSQSIEKIVERNVLRSLKNLNEYLSDYVEEFENDNEIEYNPEKVGILNDDHNYFNYFREIIDVTFQNIKLSIAKFPENIQVMSDESMNNFRKLQYKDNGIQAVNIASSRLLDYMVQNELIEPLQQIANELPGKLEGFSLIAFEVSRVVSFTINHEHHPEIQRNNQIETPPENTQNLIPLIKTQQNKIIQQIKLVEEYKQQVLLKMEERLHTTINKLSYHAFTHIASNLKQYIKEQETKKRFSWFYRQRQKIKLFFVKQVKEFWYRQSKAILLAQNINTSENKQINTVSRLLNFIDKSSINHDILNQLPFYYQQLFLRRNNYYNEFWFGRHESLKQVKQTIERYNHGFYGGILIIGEQNSGKTFFSNYIANNFISNSDIFMLVPPYQGSISVKTFKQQLQKTTGIIGNYDKIFNNLPAKSVMIIDDIELWWEKNKDGIKVIEQIIAIIQKYSHKCLFIANMNTYSFQIISKITNIEQNFLNIIDCKPFYAETLQEAIMFRHQSTGLELRLYNKPNRTLRPTELAALFARLFHYSSGNIGIALTTWVSHIKKFEDNIIYINVPRQLDLSVFDCFDKNIFILITQFVIHKRLTISKLERIMLMSQNQLIPQVQYLKRSGILVERNAEIYELNRFIYSHLIRKMQDSDIL